MDNCNKSNYYILCRGYVFYTFYNSSYISEESIVILLNMDIYYYSTIEVMIMIILVCTTKYLLVFFGFSLKMTLLLSYAPFSVRVQSNSSPEASLSKADDALIIFPIRDEAT